LQDLLFPGLSTDDIDFNPKPTFTSSEAPTSFDHAPYTNAASSHSSTEMKDIFNHQPNSPLV